MLFPILAVVMHKMTWRYIVVALAEVLLIAFFTNLLCHVKSWLGYIFNALALLLMNVQFGVLYWGSTFVSAVMLANLDSVNAISGKFFVYGLTVAMVLLFSFLPVCLIPSNKKIAFGLGSVTAILYISIILTGMIEYSPYRAVYVLYQQTQRSRMADKAVNDVMSNMAYGAEGNTQRSYEKNEFYSDSVSDYIKKPVGIPENPNVILIFVEGMSQNLIDDPRNIMPNVSALQDNACGFTIISTIHLAPNWGFGGLFYALGYYHYRAPGA